MFKILDGRSHFYQWDYNQKLIVSDPSIKEVHFCNRTDDCSLIVEVKDGLAEVPNILLQNAWTIRAYAYCGEYTKVEEKFKVAARSKPSDYVYTETEVKNYDDLRKEIEWLKENGVTPDLTGYATEEYVERRIDAIADGFSFATEDYVDRVTVSMENRFNSKLTANDIVAVDYEIVDGYYLRASDGGVTTNYLTDACYTKIPVNGNEKYIISTKLTGDMGIVFYNGEKYLGESGVGTGTKTDLEVVTPEDCTVLGISNRTQSTTPIVIKKVVNYEFNATEAYNKFENYDKAISNVEKVSGEALELAKGLGGYFKNEVLDYEITESGYYINTSGKRVGGTATVANACYVKIPTTVGEKYFITTKLTGDFGITFFNDDTFIGELGCGTGMKTDLEVVIPEGCNILSISNRSQDLTPIVIKKEVYYSYTAQDIRADVEELNSYEIDNDARSFAIENGLSFSFKGLDRSKVIFMTDGTRGILSDVYAVLKNHGAVFSVAPVISGIDDGHTMNDGSKQLDFLHMVEDDGGEIFAHSMNGNPLYLPASASGTGEEYFMPDDEAIAMLRDSKKRLVEEGFKIDGWIAPMGRYNNRVKEYYHKYYRYAYKGSDREDSALHFPRPYLAEMGLEGAKALIDELEQERRVVVLFSHWDNTEINGSEANGWVGFTVNDLEELLTYMEGKNVDITTYRDCFFNYGSFGGSAGGKDGESFATEAYVTQAIQEALGGIENGSY